MKVVLDTNVFISSFLGKGPPKEIIDLWKQGQVTLCLSKDVCEEYRLVLERLGLAGSRELKEIFDLFSKGHFTLYSAKTPPLSLVPEDPKDNQLFECAVALEAPYIVSGDKAVLRVENYMGIKVVKSRDFIELVTSKPLSKA